MSVSFFVQGCPGEINLSNGNARAILSLLDIPHEHLVGCVKGNDLVVLQKRIMKTLNLEARRVLVLRETTVDDQPGMAIMIDCGIDDDYVKTRLKDLLTLVRIAISHNTRLDFC